MSACGRPGQIETTMSQVPGAHVPRCSLPEDAADGELLVYIRTSDVHNRVSSVSDGRVGDAEGATAGASSTHIEGARPDSRDDLSELEWPVDELSLKFP
jgi:hypothetical protein